MHERCAGLHVHERSVTACVIAPEGKRIEAFRATTSELLRLSEWLLAQRVTRVAMESTGVYWKPVYNLLEAHDVQLLLTKRSTHEGRPGPQDRCQGQRVDR